MSQIQVDNIYNKEATGSPNFPLGANVTGVVTATSFSGSGANLTGIDATALKDSNGTVRVQANTTGAVITGNVSVGGTLTYEDVTNVDAVGLITARSGIKVTGGDIDVTSGNIKVGTATTIDNSGVNVTGVVTATSFAGSGANLTGIDAAPQVKLNASGSIAAGKPTVVNTDGTVSQVVQTTQGLENPVASGSSNFFGNQINFPTAVYAASLDRIIVAQMEGNTSGASHVEAFSISDTGALDAHGISGTQYSGSDQYSNYSITWDSTNSKFVLCYTDQSDSNKYKARVGSLGGSDNVTITIGSAVDTGLTARNGYNNGGRECDVVYDSNSGKIVVATANSSNNAIAVVGTVSGTSITFGSPVTILSGNSDSVNLAFDASVNKIVAVVERSTNDYLYSYVGTVSGNSISWGTYQVVEADQVAAPPTIVYMTEQQKVFVAYDHDGFRAHCKIGTVSGNSITWGARTDCGTNDTTLQRAGSFMHCAYDTYAKLPAVAWRAAYSSDVLAVSAAKSISGTTATFGNIIVADSQTINSAFVCDLNKPGGVGIFYRNVSQSGQAKYRSVDISSQVTNVTGENFLGLSAASYTNGNEATIQISGNSNSNQVGLTTGQNYFVQNDGTLGLAAATPKVYAGTAVSATKLLVGKESASTPAVEILASANLGSDYGQNYFDFTGITQDSGYIRYAMMFSNVQFVNNSSQVFGFRFYKGSSGTLETGSNYYNVSKKSYTGATGITGEAQTANAFKLLGTSNNDRNNWSGRLEWANTFDSANKLNPPVARCLVDNGGSWHSVGWDYCKFTNTNTEWISGVRIFNYGSASNLSDGRITVYGYRY